VVQPWKPSGVRGTSILALPKTPKTLDPEKASAGRSQGQGNALLSISNMMPRCSKTRKMWMNAELDEQIDKWRSLQGKDAVPAKPTVKNRALELEFTVQVIEHDRLVNETAAQTQYNVEDDPMAERERAITRYPQITSFSTCLVFDRSSPNFS
jgi:hypothetical protein